ncbi:MAG: hypothetical protein ACYCWW_12255 [Deltaproteobacteria bacterium]
MRNSFASILAAAALTGCGRPASVPTAAAGPHSITSLHHVSLVASTTDPTNHDTYPFALAISPAVAYPNGTVAGLHLQAGDLLVSNFGDSTGAQGKGTTVELIRPSDPAPEAQTFFSGASAVASIAISGAGNPWFAEFGSDGNPAAPVQVTTPTGTLAGGGSFAPGSVPGAWGMGFNGQKPPLAAFFATDALHGTLLRIQVVPGMFNTGSLTEIAHGFGVSGNPPPAGKSLAASINGPQQMLYVKGGTQAADLLYVADTVGNRIVVVHDPSNAGVDAVNASGSVTGAGSVVFAGPPLDGPSSVTSNLDGNLVVTNNGSGGNFLVEVTPDGKLVGTVDPIALSGRTGIAGGQIVTAVATAGPSGEQQIYFTDDSDGTVKLLAP